MRTFLAAFLTAALGCGSSEPTGVAGPEDVDPPKAKLPDLAVSTLRGSEIGSPGHDIFVVYRYENRGDTIAPGIGEHRLYLAADTVPQDSDHVLGALAAEALGPGAWSGDSLTFSLPSGFPEGTYHLVLQLDATNLVDEKSDANDLAHADSSMSIIAARDMTVSSITMYPVPSGQDYFILDYLGQARDLSAGAEGEPAFAYSVHISGDHDLSLADTLSAIRLGHGTNGRDGRFGGGATLCNNAVVAPGSYYGYAFVVATVNGKPVPDPNPYNSFRRSTDSFTVPAVSSC